MSKGKLEKFAEIGTFPNVFQLPSLHNSEDFSLKGKWHKEYFENDNPLVLELGCGKGEYTVGLAERFPDKNFIGVDIKGARLWRGSKTAFDNKMNNVAFVRTRIDHIEKVFASGEVDELWVTFPDPQPQKTRERKRLTSPVFLKRYANILKPGGIVNLKTDNFPLYDYSKEVAQELKLELLAATADLYKSIEKAEDAYISKNAELLQIKTYYEKMFLEQGLKINYLSFKISALQNG